MEKLAKLGWQKLIIIAAALDIVLGIIFGAIFKAVPAGIIVGVLAAAVTGVIVFALGGGVVAGHTKGDKYKKLFMNLPICTGKDHHRFTWEQHWVLHSGSK